MESLELGINSNPGLTIILTLHSLVLDVKSDASSHGGKLISHVRAWH